MKNQSIQSSNFFQHFCKGRAKTASTGRGANEVKWNFQTKHIAEMT
jgi:uncharacterized protein YkwD